ETKSFDYLCTAVGTGGTVAGISKFAEENQQVLGFKVVNDPTLDEYVFELSQRKNFKLLEAHDGSYGKITDENIRFINNFSDYYGIQLDPVYTGKMMKRIFGLIEEDFFPENSRILAFHTGGLQGITGANRLLEKQNRPLIKLIKS
ncbi:MAG: 1-aminocyclopropane-1-carboxylate deaminase/D-cysteine desulfhydrase, partial [Kaistella sp.]